MFAVKKVSREDLYETSDHIVHSDYSSESDDAGNVSFNFDFEIVDVEDNDSDSDNDQQQDQQQEQEQEQQKQKETHNFQLFSNSGIHEIKIDTLAQEEEEDDEFNDFNSYFVDTKKRDELWDQIAKERKRPLSYYVTDTSLIQESEVDNRIPLNEKRSQFQLIAVSGEDIYSLSTEPIIKLESDRKRSIKKVLDLDLINELNSPKTKNKRGKQSRLKFKVYQNKLREIKEQGKQKRPQVAKPVSKKPFLNNKPKSFTTKPSPSIGKPKFRTE